MRRGLGGLVDLTVFKLVLSKIGHLTCLIEADSLESAAMLHIL
jgi:hypothetical protein